MMPQVFFYQKLPAWFVLLACVHLAACSKRESNDRTSASETREVETMQVTKQPMERTLAVTGSLAAREQASVSVKVAGRIKTLTVDIGSAVKKGEIVAQVDPRDYELRLQLAQAAVAQARAGLGLTPNQSADQIDLEKISTVREAKAVADEAKKTRDRARSLQKQGVTALSELDTAEAAFAVARERHEAALDEAHARKATLAQRIAEMDLAQQQLTDTNVRIPYDGVIQSRLANLGEYVSAGARIVSVVQIDPLRLRLEVSERAAAEIRPGQKVKLDVEGESQKFTGTINRVSPALNEANRMLLVEADVPNPGTLKPGQFARAEIVLKENEMGLAVPTNALIVFAGLEKVIAVEEGKAIEKNVRTGRRGRDWIEIISGLKGTEEVVLNPGGLRSGQSVTAAKKGEPKAVSAAAK